jgi:hypothetical protein
MKCPLNAYELLTVIGLSAMVFVVVEGEKMMARGNDQKRFFPVMPWYTI